MTKYIYFLFSILAKKISIYITFVILVGIIAPLITIEIQIKNIDSQTMAIENMSTYSKWIIFVLNTLFCTLIIIYIFKIGEKDGTELLVSAKPITRKKIILSKFIVLISYIIILQFLTFCLLIPIASVDIYASSKKQIAFAASLALGGLIINILVSSIILIMASFLNKIGVIIVALGFSTMLPLFSTIMTMTTTVAPENFRNPFFAFHEIKKENGLIKEKTIENIYSKSHFDQKYKTNYEYLVYFDLWYQWKRFYSIFLESKESTTQKTLKVLTNPIDFKKLKNYLFIEDKEGIKHYYIGNILNISKDENHSEKIKLQKKLVGDFEKDKSVILKNLKNQDSYFIFHALDEINEYIINKFEEKYKQDAPNINIKQNNSIFSFSQKIYLLKQAIDASSNAKKIRFNRREVEKEHWQQQNLSTWQTKNEITMQDSNKLLEMYTEDYISTTSVTILWTLIAILSITFSIWIYLRRDFK